MEATMRCASMGRGGPRRRKLPATSSTAAAGAATPAREASTGAAASAPAAATPTTSTTAAPPRGSIDPLSPAAEDGVSAPRATDRDRNDDEDNKRNGGKSGRSHD